MGAEEELLKWLAQYDDILENGTPPPWIRCTDFPSHLWNKLMGFVDLPRKVIKSKRAIRGPDSKPGSLMWLNMFGYILFQAWRKYQDSRLIHQLDDIKSFKALQTSRAGIISFNAFLYQLCEGDDKINADTMRLLYPGLGETIDGGPIQHSISTSSGSESIDHPQRSKYGFYLRIQHFLDPTNRLYKTRLDKSLCHKPVKVPLGEGQKDGRTRCILCCEKCIKNVCTPVRTDTEERIRHGRKTTKYCPACGVVICKHCWNVFHSKDITLPACSKFHHMLTVQTRSDMRTTEGTAGDNFIVRRRQVSPREDEEEKIEEETEEDGHRRARSGKTYLPRKQTNKRGVDSDDDDDDDDSPMRQVLAVTRTQGSSQPASPLRRGLRAARSRSATAMTSAV